jgi:hypothetical protein
MAGLRKRPANICYSLWHFAHHPLSGSSDVMVQLWLAWAQLIWHHQIHKLVWTKSLDYKVNNTILKSVNDVDKHVSMIRRTKLLSKGLRLKECLKDSSIYYGWFGVLHSLTLQAIEQWPKHHSKHCVIEKASEVRQEHGFSENGCMPL